MLNYNRKSVTRTRRICRVFCLVGSVAQEQIATTKKEAMQTQVYIYSVALHAKIGLSLRAVGDRGHFENAI